MLFVWISLVRKPSTVTFLTVPPLFLAHLLFQKTFTTFHTTVHAVKFFPHHITCRHPCTSSTWNHTWSKSCIVPTTDSVISPPQGWTLRQFLLIILTCFVYAFMHEHTLPAVTSIVPTMSLVSFYSYCLKIDYLLIHTHSANSLTTNQRGCERELIIQF